MVFAHALFIGRTTLDAVYWLEQIPPEDTKAFAENFRATLGGPACNAAITHALLGGKATLMTAIGTGPWADMVRERLRTSGIGVIDVAAGSGFQLPLTTVLVATKNATRTIVNPPASGILCTFPHEWNEGFGATPAITLTDGFYLQESLHLVRQLHDTGVPVCLDGGSWKPGTAEVAPLLAAAICSERFAVPETTGTPSSTLAWFARQGVPRVAVTRGNRSILGQDSGRNFEIDVAQIEAVDTLGAGDVLHGAFCGLFAGGLEFELALRQAAKIATRACQAIGLDQLAGTVELK